MYLNKSVRAPAAVPAPHTDTLATRARVLIVANEPDTCLLLSTVLSREGCYVALVCEVAEVGKILRDEVPPDVVLIDDSFSLDKVEGLVRCIRAHRTWDAVILYVLSSRDSEDQEKALFDMGVDDYVLKPLKTKSLVARIRRRMLNV